MFGTQLTLAEPCRIPILIVYQYLHQTAIIIQNDFNNVNPLIQILYLYIYSSSNFTVTNEFLYHHDYSDKRINDFQA